jgi:DNA (cytosine-5)-methyltransferase 1
MEPIKLGSLFSGSGGFELGAILAGIRPIWNSEIEPFPIRVTTKRLPFVKYYGDINTLDGHELEPVDIITFGSPCTDMSIAGRREGLDGKQSVLFHQAVRIIKEMREQTNGTYPRYIVWENVPGAFSSNKGEDFRTVLEEICRVKDPEVSVAGSEKWQPAGCILGDGYSVAWRVLDAQHWGVPQRRKRIYLVADFAGLCAGKILFESEGLSGYSAQGFRAWQGAAGRLAPGTGASGAVGLNDQSSTDAQLPRSVFENHGADARYKGPLSVNPSLTAQYGTGGNNQPLVLQGGDDERERACDVQQTAECTYSASKNSYFTQAAKELAGSLVATDYKDPPLINSKMRVRRLVPAECARLQGFPDWWCSGLETADPTEEEISFWQNVFEMHRKALGKPTRPKTPNQVRKWLQAPYRDSSEYKMWGNGVALPCVWFVLSGIAYFFQDNEDKA